MDLRAGDSWGMLACLCTVLWHLPAVPALNRTGDPGPGPSIQKTYDLTRYLEHQLRSLAGTYATGNSLSQVVRHLSPRQSRQHFLPAPSPALQLHCGALLPLELLFCGLCTLRPPLPQQPDLRFFLLPAPPRPALWGSLCPANQRILPERLLRASLFLHFSEGESITLTASTVTSMQMASLLEKLGEAYGQRHPVEAGPVSGNLSTRSTGSCYLPSSKLAALPSSSSIALSFSQLNYLGPPFNEPDFNPPRLGADTLPRATVNLEVWQSLNDKLRLTQNYEAYSHLLCYLRALNRQAATAELRRSLAHFCTSLQGLLGSIAGVMAALGYPLPQPLPGSELTWAPGPAHSDFLQKMDDFWLLKELQTWLWRSAKDFNRLKKKMQPPAAAVTLHLEAHGF